MSSYGHNLSKVQGLADVYNRFKYPYGSEQANDLNRKIFETIYFAALTESMELAKIEGPYETFEGSPFSNGILQFHMWGISQDNLNMQFIYLKFNLFTWIYSY